MLILKPSQIEKLQIITRPGSLLSSNGMQFSYGKKNWTDFCDLQPKLHIKLWLSYNIYCCQLFKKGFTSAMRICKFGYCFSRGTRLRTSQLLATAFILAAYLTHCAGAMNAWIPCNPDDPKACRFGAICRPINTGPSVYVTNDSAPDLHICQCPSLACHSLMSQDPVCGDDGR